MKRHAISYIRFSSAPQAKGSSRYRQTAMVQTWLDKHPNYVLADLSFEDLGKSGWKGHHIEGGMGELLAAVEAGFIRSGDCVLVEALDRAGRLETMEMLSKVISPILQAGVTLVTLDDGTEYTKASLNGGHIFLLVAKIQAANQFSENLSRRVRASYEKREQEAKAGKVPKRRTPLWLNSEGQLVEHIAPHIMTAFELYADGFGERTILRKLQATGVEEFKDLYGSTLKRWLINPIAIGKWKDIPKVYPAVVSDELFYRVQQKISSNRTTRPSSPTKHHLTGIVKCAHCGRNFNYHVFKDQPTVLQCSNRFMSTADKCENSKSIPLGVLNRIVLITSVGADMEIAQAKKLSVNQKRIIVIDGELETLAVRLAGLAQAISQVGPMTELLEQITALKTEQEKLQAEHALLTAGEIPLTYPDFIEHVKREDPDKMLWNKDLQLIGYTITCDKSGKLVTSHGNDRVFQYTGYIRKTKNYSFTIEGKEKVYMIPVQQPTITIPKKIVIPKAVMEGMKRR
ncbi:recombinase family protein [Pseudomonas sp. JQ170]|uniref:recombinase family protein n=1 Tax=unclassified Pseudomonas TaxID=196821 RepID=UPI00264D5887|nr:MULTISPECIES: recombinase family protein [unclassified Pseudomonas]MDN7141979.1 recombinase family protein [Pseudomonas sp. JQ170]WRO78276.1 recombinase family protein [Pseudomonas sp. 170C]